MPCMRYDTVSQCRACGMIPSPPTRLDIIKDLYDMLNSELSIQHGHRLEWIVIWLIELGESIARPLGHPDHSQRQHGARGSTQLQLLPVAPRHVAKDWMKEKTEGKHDQGQERPQGSRRLNGPRQRGGYRDRGCNFFHRRVCFLGLPCTLR
eukprot:Polyplicarium_translucidae@DN1529_c0_g1_i2.p1